MRWSQRFASWSSFRSRWPGSTPVVRAFTSEDTVAVPIAAFECRGLEPIGWTPTGPYVVRTEGGVAYTVGAEGEDLAEDWCDYDEKSGESVSVDASIQFEFRLHRG